MSLQFRRGVEADRTSITPLPGEPLWITDTDELYVGDGSTAGGVLITGGGGGGAPTNATYITQTSNGTLTNEQALASLATGILKNTTTTGVLSIAVGTDLPSHTHTLADITDDGTMAAQNANNVAITGGSLTDVTVATGTYSSRVNEAIMHSVRKASAGTINKGEVVRITGSSGTHLQVELADASVEATSSGTIGIAATTITSTTTGYMMIEGELTQLSNVLTASFTNGDALWLSETTGAFTTTRPTQPAHGVFLGWVVEASNGSAGRIYVKVINYSELNELHDVLISGVADNHFLVYDNATSLWKNESPSDARTSLGLGTAATSNTGDFAAASHTHAAGDITSGTLAIARGGTNLGTTPTNGQLLIGNGTDYTLSTLTAGSNVTITNASGSITIASTGGSGGGTKTYAFFTPLDNQPPASNFATLDTRNSIAVLDFDAALQDESAIFVGIIPEAATPSTDGLKVRIHWIADTATSGNVRWQAHFQRLTDDVDTATFDTNANNEANGAAATGTNADGTPTVTEITCASSAVDGLTAGDAYRLKIIREQSDTTNDTMSGDACLIAVEVRSGA